MIIHRKNFKKFENMIQITVNSLSEGNIGREAWQIRYITREKFKEIQRCDTNNDP